MATPLRPGNASENSSFLPPTNLKELEGILEGLEWANRTLESDPNDEAAKLALEVATLEEALFFRLHDNAGAFKSAKLGQRIAGLFEPGADGKVGATFENGQLKLAEFQQDRRFLLVNMMELDRFNKEGGGHAAGDAALEATVEKIKEVLTTQNTSRKGNGLAPLDYQIYRFDGNTFAVDLASIPLREFGELVQQMEKAEPQVAGVDEAAPLVVRGLALEDAAGLVNHLQDGLSAKEHAVSLDEKEAVREVMTMFRRTAAWDLEISKFAKRAERVRKMLDGITQAEEAIQAAQEEITKEKLKAKKLAMEKDAEVFFGNYMKKSFQETELSTLGGFKAVLEQGDAYFQETVDRLAMERADTRFEGVREQEDEIARIVDAWVKERGIPPKDLKPAAPGEHGPTGAEPAGKRLLTSRADAAEAAEKKWQADPENQLLKLKARKARLEQRIEAARRDAGTGLLDRGVYYEELEADFKEGNDVAVLFIDLAFLKLFDQAGGTEVGDKAIATAASLLEQAIKEAGVSEKDGCVYRYAGDEFLIKVRGGNGVKAKDTLMKVRDALEGLRDRSEPIPATAKSSAEYAPIRLSFNYGHADSAMVGELLRAARTRKESSESEPEDAAHDLNFLAELMTKAADGGIEYNKAYSRFLLLIGKLHELQDAPDPSAQAPQVEALINFSNKAIFAELGGVDRLRAFALNPDFKGAEHKAALEHAVLQYVLEQVEKIRDQEKAQKSAKDNLIAAQAKVEFLTHRLSQAASELEHTHAIVLDLRARVKAAEEEKRKLIDVRWQIDRLDKAA